MRINAVPVFPSGSLQPLWGPCTTVRHVCVKPLCTHFDRVPQMRGPNYFSFVFLGWRYVANSISTLRTSHPYSSEKFEMQKKKWVCCLGEWISIGNAKLHSLRNSREGSPQSPDHHLSPSLHCHFFGSFFHIQITSFTSNFAHSLINIPNFCLKLSGYFVFGQGHFYRGGKMSDFWILHLL